MVARIVLRALAMKLVATLLLSLIIPRRLLFARFPFAFVVSLSILQAHVNTFTPVVQTERKLCGWWAARLIYFLPLFFFTVTLDPLAFVRDTGNYHETYETKCREARGRDFHRAKIPPIFDTKSPSKPSFSAVTRIIFRFDMQTGTVCPSRKKEEGNSSRVHIAWNWLTDFTFSCLA